ncbi:pyrophosphatase PpaX [Salibacterium salarium]|uniref:Pyrophosphatase PpaX n=1 Tax=Salibacterium salarium TaxID=284579 RepID=A0A3R9Q056_9BACI|nr:pyrophosphatase PpaX [Salibacterium salarium]RSL30771.1 pyrophosphatase PpaX [Salibacterium salarium]
MTINTVLFDFDGTLVNTNELIIKSYEHVLDLYFPGKYGREEIIGFIGQSLPENFKELDPDRAEEMIQLYQKHNLEHHDELIEDYEGVAETIEALDNEGYKLAIVTTKRKQTAHKGLKISGLLPHFSSVITLDDVEHVKPDSEPLDQAMRELGAKPEETMMVGDSKYDILGGKNAGVKTAGVAWTIKGEAHLSSFQPDVMLQTMPDLLDYLGVKTT